MLTSQYHGFKQLFHAKYLHYLVLTITGRGEDERTIEMRKAAATSGKSNGCSLTKSHQIQTSKIICFYLSIDKHLIIVFYGENNW